MATRNPLHNSKDKGEIKGRQVRRRSLKLLYGGKQRAGVARLDHSHGGLRKEKSCEGVELQNINVVYLHDYTTKSITFQYPNTTNHTVTAEGKIHDGRRYNKLLSYHHYLHLFLQLSGTVGSSNHY